MALVAIALGIIVGLMFNSIGAVIGGITAAVILTWLELKWLRSEIFKYLSRKIREENNGKDRG